MNLSTLKQFPQSRKESVITPEGKQNKYRSCNNYSALSAISTTYEILDNILLAS